MLGTLKISTLMHILISTCAIIILLLYPACYTHRRCPACSAFATIDGNSFSIVPAADLDIELYHRTTELKQSNPDLKIFISVGERNLFLLEYLRCARSSVICH
jgi:hypothetical protein